MKNILNNSKNDQESLRTRLIAPPPRKTKRRAGFGGFTLAETLITLAIIGIIAALTIPNLLQKHHWAVRKAQLKEAQAVLSTAISKYAAQNNINDMNKFLRTGDENSNNLTNAGGVLNIAGKDVGNAILYIVLADTFKDITYCIGLTPAANFKSNGITLPSQADCSKIKEAIYYEEDGSLHSTNVGMGEEYDRLILKNKKFSFGVEWRWNTNKEIYVDVNGYDKGPNRHGHDVFGFRVKPDGTVVPCGAPGYTCKYGNNTFKALNAPNYWKDNNIK